MHYIIEQREYRVLLYGQLAYKHIHSWPMGTTENSQQNLQFHSCVNQTALAFPHLKVHNNFLTAHNNFSIMCSLTKHNVRVIVYIVINLLIIMYVCSMTDK